MGFELFFRNWKIVHFFSCLCNVGFLVLSCGYSGFVKKKKEEEEVQEEEEMDMCRFAHDQLQRELCHDW